MEDVQRFVAIKRLHETSGLPLVEAAARALKGVGPSPAWDDATPSEAITIEQLWAGLIETLPELLVVVDDAGHIVAANSMARSALSVKTGASLTSLAPPGWQVTYRALRRGQLNHGGPIVLAMRGKSGIVYADVHFVPLGRTPDGAAVIVGTLQREPAPPLSPSGPLH